MNREPYIEQIHQYLSGELDAAARKSFEEALEKDEALKEAFLFEQQLLGALEQSFDQRAREDISQVHQQLRAEGFFSASRGKAGKLSVLRVAAAAAALAALCAGIWWFALRPQPFEPQVAFRQHFRPEEEQAGRIIEGLTSVGFAPEMNPTDSLREALVLYRKEDYPAAFLALSYFLDNHPQNDTAQFFLALTEMSLSNFDSAARLLSGFSNPGNPEMEKEARWYLALCFLQLEGRREDARKLLEMLAEDEAFGQQIQARELFGRLPSKD